MSTSFTNPNLVFHSDFCGACSELLADGVEHKCPCPEAGGQYCTQCGQAAGHKMVCYPDARRRVHTDSTPKPKPILKLPWVK